MNEKEIRAEIERRKNTFHREQAALPFAEKVRIAFELNKLQNSVKRAQLSRQKDTALPPADDSD